MIRFGMRSSLWTDTWTNEAAERLIPEAKRHGIEVIEIALLTPEAIGVEHSRALFREPGIAPSGSLCLPMEAPASPCLGERSTWPRASSISST